MEKVRPEFSFRQDDELRTQRAQVGLDGETKVEREVEDAIVAEARARKLLPGGCCCGDEHAVVG